MKASVRNKIQNYFVSAVMLVLVSGAAQAIYADPIPYPTPGVYNTVTYSFTAASTGNITAYFAGSTASYDNQLGLLVNGVSTGVIGLDNHTSVLGQSLNLGSVTAGDTLVFVLHNLTLGADAFSDPALNVPYDLVTDNHNHVYSTPYTATSPILDAIPTGTFVAFEDLRFPDSDFNYNDETFVFTNVAENHQVPEPSSLLLLGAGLLGAGLLRRKNRLSEHH